MNKIMRNSRVRIKVCGITQQQDAEYASKLGADAIGLIFYKKSPRNISLEDAANIAKSVKPFVTTVAVVVNPTKNEMHDILNNVDIDIIQFHGDESAEFCDYFRKPYYKAIRVSDSDDIEKVLHHICQYTKAIAYLLDTYDSKGFGGTGKKFDWLKLKDLQHQMNKPIILAGGLNPANINQAIDVFSPYAVDVNSGVETSPGFKNFELLNDFFNNIP